MTPSGKPDTGPGLREVLSQARRVDAPLPPLPQWTEARRHLAATFDLSDFEVDLLCLACLPDVDSAWGDLFGELGSTWRRPTLGSALRVLVSDPEQRRDVAVSVHATRAMALGLLRLAAIDAPLPDRPLRASPPVVATLLSVPAQAVGVQARPLDLQAGQLLLHARPSLQAIVTGLERSAVVQVARTPSRSCRELAQALGSHRGMHVVVIDGVTGTRESLQDACALAALGPSIVVLHGAEGSARWVLEQGPSAGVLVVDAARATLEASTGIPIRLVVVPPPTPPEMSALWRQVLPELSDRPQLDGLANQTRVTLDEMRRAAISARALGPLTAASVQRALATARSDPPGTMARTSHPQIPWDALVVPVTVRHQLTALCSRVTHRVTVQYRWGMGHETQRGDGIVAMLHGDSGVGKTYACEVLASELGLPLVKVDLSQVVSKYIGETEKNLEGVFSAAEGFASVLLFDEADAVFGKRTGVRDAHDRYANIETNYLLQRLESFEGIAVLSTNMLKNIDEAFLRRLQLLVHMPRPTAPLRRDLWERVLPDVVRGLDVDTDALARRFDLVGGEIRNAAVRAAYAAAVLEQRVTQRLLHDSVRVEFAKKGRPFPA